MPEPTATPTPSPSPYDPLPTARPSRHRLGPRRATPEVTEQHQLRHRCRQPKQRPLPVPKSLLPLRKRLQKQRRNQNLRRSPASRETNSPVGEMLPTVPSTVKLTGKIKNAAGEGIANVVVVLISPRGTVLSSSTDVEGNYSFIVTPSSLGYRLIPSKEGFRVCSTR